MQRRHLISIIAVALLAAGAHAQSSADDDVVLPFTVQVPYGFLFLHLPAVSAGIPPLHAWGFDAWTTVTNNFIYSDNVGEYLEARTSRAPMTRADFAAIAAAHPGEDDSYFDGQITTLYARVGTTVAPSFAVGARLSLIGISGGKGMDSIVEGFHDIFGFGQARREVVRRGEIAALVRIDGHEELSQQNPRVGVGDPIAYAMWAPDPWGAWRIALVGGIKVPVGSTSRRLSTGRADYGAAFAATGDLGRFCVNVNAGVIAPGDIAFLPRIDPSPVAGIAISTGYRFGARSVWVQLQWEQSPLRRVTDISLAHDVFDVSIGMRFPVKNGVRGYVALTENVEEFDNSSDIGFHGGVTWSFDPK